MMKHNQRTKTQDVLEYMQSGKPITSLIAFEKFGATRLSAIIYNLRKQYPIETINRLTKDKYGHTIQYAEYVLTES